MKIKNAEFKEITVDNIPLTVPSPIGNSISQANSKIHGFRGIRANPIIKNPIAAILYLFFL